MSRTINIRPALAEDLPALTRIYNHYIEYTRITFDTSLFTVATLRPWFDQFRPGATIGYWR